MFWKLIGMIALGILGAALSYYNKNHLVRLFDDILGREPETNPAVSVGRGFLYGFLFPIYFVLLVAGLVALIAFLIVAGIIAAIVFVMVWVTEKLLPHEWIGSRMQGFFEVIGLRGPAPMIATQSPPPVPEEIRRSERPAPPPAPPSEAPKEEPEKPDPSKEAGSSGEGINLTRRHSLD